MNTNNTAWTRTLVWALLLALVIAACGDANGDTTPTTDPPANGSVIAGFETADGASYRVQLTGEAAAHARTALAAGDHPGIPNGVIQPGDGGVNIGHDWHVDDVEFAEFTMEVCDGTVSYVDSLGYEDFVDQHGDRFCPWSAELVDLIEP